jgi:pSer/pThr/pTyr-binding forkhead associated (FHA) protein
MKAKLILSMDGLVLKEIELNKERMTIGRRPTNDIKIDNLAISGEHAAVVTILNDSFLEDLNSTNGTLVNGRPIRKHVLIDGDVVEIGKYKLKYIAGKPNPADESANYEKPAAPQPRPVARPEEVTSHEIPPPLPEEGRNPEETQDIHGALEEELSALEETGIPPGAVRILNGEHAGRELELTKALATLGQPGVQVAVIAKRPNGYFISHVEGVNMPIVNGATIAVQAHRLVDHDII